mmetsp:Transcript_7576/g.11864  ORF Transcript_7576/g.11864 Transcript_7576/m.11864 type:complete len:81 (+) Transcript_7576:1104-1346(+)
MQSLVSPISTLIFDLEFLNNILAFVNENKLDKAVFDSNSNFQKINATSRYAVQIVHTHTFGKLGNNEDLSAYSCDMSSIV